MTWLKRSGERGGWVPSERMRGVHACVLAPSQLWPCGLNFSKKTERLCVSKASAAKDEADPFVFESSALKLMAYIPTSCSSVSPATSL